MKELMNDGTTTIIDVRTRSEFSGGHVAGSVNIPLQELEGHLDELMSKEGAIIFCCASGGRSGMATDMLQKKGHAAVHNGGGWMAVNRMKNNG